MVTPFLFWNYAYLQPNPPNQDQICPLATEAPILREEDNEDTVFPND